MDFLSPLAYIINLLLSAFNEFVIYTLGILSTKSWLYLKEKQPSNAFWHLHPRDDVVAISLYAYPQIPDRYYIPIGDALSYGEIVAFLKQRYRIKNSLHNIPRTLITDWQKVNILIGGGKSNITTRYLLAALNPPFYGRDHEDERNDAKGLKNRNTKIVLEADQSDGRDYAYIIRTLDPYNQDKYVFLIIGAYTTGTYAATQWLTKPRNLRWVWRACLCQQITNLVRRRPAFDSLQIIFQVRVSPGKSKAPLPEIEDTQVWYQKEDADTKTPGKRMKKRVYFFHTPANYKAEYIRWCKEMAD